MFLPRSPRSGMSIAVATLMLVTAVPALAATLDEMAAKQSETDRAEADARLAKARGSSMPMGAPPVAMMPMNKMPVMESAPRKPDDRISLSGIYGLGKQLRADILLNGMPLTLGAGESAMGYRVDGITPHEVKLVKIDAKGRSKKVDNLTLYLVGASSAPPSVMPSMPMPLPTFQDSTFRR